MAPTNAPPKGDPALAAAANAADRLRWIDALPGGGMPAHQYVVFGGPTTKHGIDKAAVSILLDAIGNNPNSFRAYFRGYQTPSRYVELPDGRRYWRTSMHGTQMLNRCTLESVEPTRRVDSGAKPIPWDGPPWAKFGSPWPPGFVEVEPKTWRYFPARDWRRQYRCSNCREQFFWSAPERPCPRCRAIQDQGEWRENT